MVLVDQLVMQTTPPTFPPARRHPLLSYRQLGTYQNLGSTVPLTICRIWHIVLLMAETEKPLVWLEGEVKTPPFSKTARLEAGFLLRLLQQGEKIGLPHSRSMPSIGARCHELRINDERGTWRLIYRIDADAVVVLDVFKKKSQQTPKKAIEACKSRIKLYDGVR